MNSTRRDFLKQAGFSAVLAWHLPMLTCADEPVAKTVAPQAARFRSVQLRTAQLDEMRQFYTQTLGLPLEPLKNDREESAFAVRVGESILKFVAAEKGSEPFYHFAFNIPENQFAACKQWLSKRCPLLKENGNGADEIFFAKWNAHAVYFADPSGNIGELIARHTLKNPREGEFTVQSLLCVSEIGLVSAEPAKLERGLAESFGLKPYQGSSMFVGDEHGLFVLPPTGRPWIPERRQKATAFLVEVTLSETGEKTLRVPDMPYWIQG